MKPIINPDLLVNLLYKHKYENDIQQRNWINEILTLFANDELVSLNISLLPILKKEIIHIWRLRAWTRDGNGVPLALGVDQLLQKLQDIPDESIAMSSVDTTSRAYIVFTDLTMDTLFGIFVIRLDIPDP